MIQPNELRIGNWFHLEGRGYFQWEYRHFDDYIKDKASGWNVERSVVSDKVEPILLTSEIMEKCGFESERYGYTHKKGIWVCSLTFEMDFLAGPSEEEHNIKITSLHQLQNLYFSLTGEELTINFKDLTYQ